MLSETEKASICRAKVLFSLPGSEDTFEAIVDSGSEANVLSMDFVTEGNLSRYLRPAYVELFPIGDKMLPSNFQISLPIKFANNPDFHMVDFMVLNIPSKPLLGQPWLRENDLCIDMGFTCSGIHQISTSNKSQLPYFSTPLVVESLPEPEAISLAVQFSRYSVPYVSATIADNNQPEELLVDTGAMVNILSAEKYKQLNTHGDIELSPSDFRTLKGAGTSIKVLGQTTLQLNFLAFPMKGGDSHDDAGKTVQISETFVVAEDPGDDFTLGLNFIATRSWLLDPLAAVLIMPDGYGLKLSYPRDKNLQEKEVHFDDRQNAVKVHLTSLQFLSTLSGHRGLDNLAKECSAVVKYYKDLIQNPTQTTLDLSGFIKQPQYGVEAYHKKIAYQWVYDHPKYLIHQLGPNLKNKGAALDHSHINFRDGPLLRTIKGYRRSDEDHLIKDGLNVTRNLLFPIKKPNKAPSASEDASLHECLDTIPTPQGTATPQHEEHQADAIDTQRNLQTNSKLVVASTTELQMPANEKECSIETVQPTEMDIANPTPNMDDKSQILFLKQMHTNCTQQQLNGIPPHQKARDDDATCTPRDAPIPTPPLPNPAMVAEPITELPLKDYFQHQIELEKCCPGSIKQALTLQHDDTMLQPSPGTSSSLDENPRATHTTTTQPFLAIRPRGRAGQL